MSDPLNPHDDAIERTLDRIREAARVVQDGDDGFDPDGLLDALEHETSTLAKFLQSVHSGEKQRCDLVELVQDATERLVVQSGVAVVLRMQAEQDLPPAGVSRTNLSPLINQILMAGIDHAGAGGEVAITLREEHGHAVFEMTAHPGVDGLDPLRPTNIDALRTSADASGIPLQSGIDQQGVLHLALETVAAKAR